jgi:ketosteroid isomerase-like protein
MSTSNAERARQYLAAVASLESAEQVSEFFASDGVFQEFPNRIAPNGRVRHAADLRTAFEQGRKILKSQSYAIQNIVEAGDEVAIELVWTGVLASAVLNLAAGTEMKAFVAIFLTFRDGKIVSQRNYDCYPPFEGQSEPTPSA